ncbi:hypothetical protein SL053_001644 [Flavobacterium psychrophilum]|uniref:Uncharacterized protein n=7 Tax=Flavobacterium psychrophilum TaxID=96345 RepID=A6GZQ3_FLAPJ|nr:hypothetical protein [Flavobacterium psychrophilum]AIG30276.1 hypothetical protein IA03_07240 [Flavobacterium psychrophilum]AIG32552.1 hypothetical protein IA01_07240 [Flavobacterium psychrophilum]AIG34707.1 hypothetical protein IA02_06650 [Flavobacterium psychrophilum]AIG37072.1 hypothetical protein IA04_07150 [Flavobacterium psychrophilum]AIG39336.1 hypothetical protein IA05_07235 [Flavobacterium psychrophilum]
MRKEDYLTTQINQLGYVLKRILEKLTGTKSNDQLGVVWVVDNFKLKEKLGFDLAILDTISDENLIPFLITKEGFNDSNIELFADVLVKIDKEKYAKKALQIYNYVNQITATFSFERDLKIKEINL